MNKGIRFVNTLTLAIALGLPAVAVSASDIYFVDGYHGGIYGHYPVKWKTRFIVDQLRQNPQWRIGLEIEPETWDTVQVRTPDAYRDFAAILGEGRVEFTNPTYAQPYCYNISGESLIRQFAYGIDKIRSHFPGVNFTTYAVEEPCFTSCLPAVLKGFGFKYASLKCPNTCWGGYMAPYGGQLVNWTGPDGTSIVAVPRYGCEELEDNSVWQTTAWGNSPRYIDACRKAGIENPVGMCYQDAGWRNGPWLKRNGSGSNYVLWTDYIENHTPGQTSDDYHLTQDDVLVNLMWGSQVMQRIGRGVRTAENKLVMAEKLAAIAMLEGDNAPLPDQTKMDEAWRQLMLAQHHDSWIVPYNGLWHFGTWADAIDLWTSFAGKVADSEMARMAASITSGNRLMVKVFNTCGVTREETVCVSFPYAWGDNDVVLTDYTGREIKAVLYNDTTDKVNRLVFKATVPPMGYATYRISRVPREEKGNAMAAAAPGGETGREVVMENDKVRLKLDLGKGGTVKSLILKSAGGREFAPSAGDYAMGEMKGYFYDEKCFHSSAENPVRVVSRTDLPHLQSITLAGEIAGHPFTQRITLTAGSARVDYDLNIDWQGHPGIGEYRERHWNHDRRGFCDDRYKLCVLFPTSFATEKLYKDAPFDVCLSRNEDTFFNSWSNIKHNVILNWVDAAASTGEAGLGILSDHTTSYVHGKDYPVGLTLQYSGQGLWGRDYLIDRPTHVRFAILPHAGNEGADAMSAESDRFNEPLQAFVCGGDGHPATGSLCGMDNPGYRVSAAVRHGDEVTLRLHNTHASDSVAKISLGLPKMSVVETDLLGNTTDMVKTSGKGKRTMFSTSMPRNGFRTFSIKKSQTT